MNEQSSKYQNSLLKQEKNTTIGKKSFEDEFSLDEIIKVSKRRKKLIIFVGLAVTGLITANSIATRIFNPTYQGTFSLLINDPLTSNKDSLDLNNSALESIARNTTQNDIPTLKILLKSPTLLDDLAKKYSIPYEKLQKMIYIDNILLDRRRADGILKVNIRINNKKEGLNILNDLSKLYLEAALKQKQRKISDGLKFLNSQAPSIQRRNRELENQLEEFRKKYSLIEPLITGEALKEQEMEIDKAILSLESNKSSLLDVRQEIIDGKLTAKSFKQIINSSENNSGEVGLEFVDIDQGLLSTLVELENELAQASTKYTKNSKIIEGLKKRVEEIKPFFIKNQLEAVETAIDLASSQIERKKELKEIVKNKFSKNPSLIKEYNNLQLRLENSYQNLNNLLEARELFQLRMAQATFPWRIIAEPKMFEKPVKPSISRNILLGIFLGIFTGIVLAIIRDRFDYVFHSSEEVKEDLGLPILANIPYIDKFKDIRNEIDSSMESFSKEQSDESGESIYQRFFYQESLRTLFTSLRFIGGEKKLKVISITSSVPREGKSLINLLFAKTLSDLGQKVLMIDGDMRKPTLHKRLQMNNLKGLSNYLSNPDVSFESIVKTYKGFKNIDLVTSGPIPPDSTRLIGSDRMKQLLNNLVKDIKYDYVLLDLPPILGLSDVQLVAKNIDGIMLITSISYVNRNLPNESIDSLKLSGGNILGIISNNIKEPKAGEGISGSQLKNTYYEYINNPDINLEIENKDISSFSSNKFLKILNSNLFLNSLFLKIKNVNDKFFNWIDN